jgi:hypothetical protein
LPLYLAISGAKLVMLAPAGHIFTSDQEEAAHRAILQFLDAVAGQRREMQA